MRKTLLIAAILTLVAAPAFAQFGGDEKSRTVSFGGGLSAPGSGIFRDYARTGFTFSGYVTGPLAGPVGWRVEGGRDGFRLEDEIKALCDTVGGDCKSPSIMRFGGGVQFGGHGSGTTLPYALFTVGAFNTDPGVAGEGKSTNFGMSFGTGINWAVGETWGLGIDFHYNGFWPSGDAAGEDADSEWYSVTTFGVFFRF